MGERSAESRRLQRENEKEKRKQKCNLSDEHYRFIRESLENALDGRPNFAEIAKKTKQEFDLDCEIAWLRPHVASKWEQWTGKAERRKRLRQPELVPQAPQVSFSFSFFLLGIGYIR